MDRSPITKSNDTVTERQFNRFEVHIIILMKKVLSFGKVKIPFNLSGSAFVYLHDKSLQVNPCPQ